MPIARLHCPARCRTASVWLAALLLLSTQAASAQQPVTLAQAERIAMQARRGLSGSLVSLQSSALSPRLSGVVAKVHVQPGDQVSRGDPIIELDAELAELELRRRQAALEEAEQRLSEAERLRDERQRLAQQRNLAQSQAEAAAAEASIARSVLARLRAELAQQQALLRRHQVRAPFSGVVTSRQVDIGEWVDPSQPVVELLADQALRFEVQVPQEWWSEIDETTAVELKFDALPQRVFVAQVEARVPQQDPVSRSFLLRLRLEAPDAGLTVGMSGQALFAEPAATVKLSLPRDAIVRYPDGTAGVWTVQDRDTEPRVQPRKVRLGSSLGERVEVLEGLAADEWVVLRGNERLRADEVVRIVESD